MNVKKITQEVLEKQFDKKWLKEISGKKMGSLQFSFHQVTGLLHNCVYKTITEIQEQLDGEIPEGLKI